MIKISAVCLWVSEAGLFAWEVDGPGSISLWWIWRKIFKHVVENCYGNITCYARVVSCCTSDHLRACHQKPCTAQGVTWAAPYLQASNTLKFQFRCSGSMASWKVCGRGFLPCPWIYYLWSKWGGKNIFPQSARPCSRLNLLVLPVKRGWEASAHPWDERFHATHSLRALSEALLGQ